jgi:hypothetical protein
VSRLLAASATLLAVGVALLILFSGYDVGIDAVVTDCRNYGAYKTEQVQMTCTVQP